MSTGRHLTWHRPAAGDPLKQWTATDRDGVTRARARRREGVSAGYWGAWTGHWPGSGPGDAYATTLGEIKDKAEKGYAARQE